MLTVKEVVLEWSPDTGKWTFSTNYQIHYVIHHLSFVVSVHKLYIQSQSNESIFSYEIDGWKTLNLGISLNPVAYLVPEFLDFWIFSNDKCANWLQYNILHWNVLKHVKSKTPHNSLCYGLKIFQNLNIIGISFFLLKLKVNEVFHAVFRFCRFISPLQLI